MLQMKAAECYLLGSDAKYVLSLSPYRSIGSFPEEWLREQMHSSIISSVTVISRENPICSMSSLKCYLSPLQKRWLMSSWCEEGGEFKKNQPLFFTSFGCGLMIWENVQLQLNEDGSPGSGLLTYVSVVVVAPQTDGLRWWWGTSDLWCWFNPKIGERSCVSPFCAGEIQEAMSSLAGYETSPQSLVCTDGSSLFCQTLFN